MSNLSDNIWFTRKARIQTSERLLSNDNHSQIMLIVYSLISLILSIVLLKNTQAIGAYSDMIGVVMSLIITIISLVIGGKNFKGRGLSLKNHYISLQRLYLRAIDAEANNDLDKLAIIREEYNNILELEENHHSIDDIVFRVLNRQNLTTRKPNKMEILIAYSYKVIRYATIVFIYIFPFAMAIYFLIKNNI